MTPVIAQLREYWRSLDIDNSHTASEAEIVQFEERHGVRMPPLLREYFLELNGTRAGVFEDTDALGFWHLDQLEIEDYMSDPSRESGRLFIFADWMIDAQWWGVHLSNDPSQSAPVSVIYNRIERITDSFEEFLLRYVARDYDGTHIPRSLPMPRVPFSPRARFGR